jgi:SAM-dependent methyltransferase
MHSSLLTKYLVELNKYNHSLPILDLACGSGRNGLFCLEKNLPVVFSDVRTQALDDVKQTMNNDSDKYPSILAKFWEVDFEIKNANPLSENSYSTVMVFRYLHRPLIDKIKAAVAPNGLVVYETFTVAQAELGRPKNPEFLLKVGELAEYFSDWQVLHYFEGTKTSDTGSNCQAVAQIVARKPF